MHQVGLEKSFHDLEKYIKDFLGGPVVKTLWCQCRGLGSIPGQGTTISHAAAKDPACPN